MRIKLLLFSLQICMLMCLGGCGIEMLSEELIYDDIKNEYYDVTETEEIIESCEIIERETDEKELTDIILCKIVANDGVIQYTKYFELAYEFDEDEKEWDIDEFEPKKQDEWSVMPLIGVEDTNIENYLIGNSFFIDGTEWYINSTSIGNIREVTRDTDLAQKRDVITYSVELLSDVLLAKGELQFVYTYDEEWYLESVNVIKEFSTSYQEGKDFKVTEEVLINSLSEYPIVLGNAYYGTEQDIGISKDEIVEFSMGITEVTNLGTLQTCNCDFILKKTTACFEVSAVISFEYDSDNGWHVLNVEYPEYSVKEIILEPLIGQWKGKMSEFSGYISGMQSVNFEITEVDNKEGVIWATVNVLAENRSCIMRGYVDWIDLSVTFTFENWIVEPEINKSIHEPRLYGVIIANDGTMKSVFSLDANEFELQKVE